MSWSRLRWRAGCAAIAALAMLAGGTVTAREAQATFPGPSGRIAYVSTVSPHTPEARSAIFVSGIGQFTHPRAEFPPDIDVSPAWSPDGQTLAFHRRDQLNGDDYIMVVNADGTGLSRVVSSDDASSEHAHLGSPAWTSDGERISFVVRDPSRPWQDGIYTVGLDGTGLFETIPPGTGGDIGTVEDPSWSVDDRLVFTCSFRAGGTRDICVYEHTTGKIKKIPIDVAGRLQDLRRPRWSADGRSIIFALGYTARSNDHYVSHSEIFRVKADGTGLTQLTDSPDSCPTFPSNTNANSMASRWYVDPTPSPDQNEIVASAFEVVSTGGGGDTPCSAETRRHGLWTMDAAGRSPTLLIPDSQNSASSPDWQPVLPPVTIRVEDGHGNRLDGLKVELYDVGGDLFDDTPIVMGYGVYGFEDVPPGPYVVRVRMTDMKAPPGTPPAFDLRHAPSGDTVIWASAVIDVPDSREPVTLNLPLDDSGEVVDSSLNDLGRLDDVANVYFRTRQFVDWVRSNLVEDITTVRFSLDATTDPDTGGVVGPTAVYYRASTDRIVLSPTLTDYEQRDGIPDRAHWDTAPENAEWHEFTHHLFSVYILEGWCLHGVNHAGYTNPDTCDSLNEGFSMFLPAYASHDIEGTTDSRYDNLMDIEPNLKAWGSRPMGKDRLVSLEDIAVASLLWDLTDSSPDSEPTYVIGADGQHHPYTYWDRSAVSVPELWSQMQRSHTATISELRRSFGTPALDVDLDGDGVPDVAAVDQVFLMHGFFPIDHDQGISTNHTSHHYDVAAAQRLDAAAPRNADVGRSDHKEFDGDGTHIRTLKPRHATEPAESANIEIDVRDSSGRSLSGATVEITTSAPGEPYVTTRQKLGSGDRALVHLELPPYRDHLLPAGAPLPECDPERDRTTNVSVRISYGIYGAREWLDFDSCTYQRAVLSADGPAALSTTATFPEDTLVPTTTATAKAKPAAEGSYTRGSWSVTFACTDPQFWGFATGCQRTEYRVDGGDVRIATGPVHVDEEGLHTLEFRSIDGAANVENFQTMQLGVDKTPPSSEIVLPVDGMLVPSGAPIVLAGNATDAGAGVASVCFEVTESTCIEASRTTGDLWTAIGFAPPPGTYEVRMRVTDEVGHTGLSPVRRLITL